MKKLSLDRNLLKNRTVLGLLCILLSLLICFGITPLMNSALREQSEIVRVKTDIADGTQITASMLETVTVGSYNLPTDVLKSKSDAVGKYARAELQRGDYILSGKLSAQPPMDSPYLENLDGTESAISVTIPSFAAGLSGKLEAGDIVSILSSDTDTKTTNAPEELRYVKVLTATASTGSDKDDMKQSKNDSSESEDDKEKSLPATLTLLVNEKQAQLLANLDINSKLHTVLVYRGTKTTADQFLQKQTEYFNTLKTQGGQNNGN